MTAFDDFDHITLHQRYASDDGGFDALFEQALTKMRNTCPEGFPASAPGRGAWDQLDPGQRERALDSLLFVHFCEHRREQDEALHHDAITAESSYLRDGDLDHLAQIAVSARGSVTVDSAELWRAVKELRLLVHRVALLQTLRTTEPMTAEALNLLEEQLRQDLYGDEQQDGL
ncbi:hypothetical protein [Streptomyces sp. PH10-H1]|uniref:hypothetical protein n=1 Tax=Streptomyces sp. PH10-H1 TaxID=3046212 RepID=UPI0024BA952C|nr:hypothetical protein [Streptomyces sp. PH10-H1]MDJ0341773.1 hypothetical protein [Streptomyces sp. PH10-H1]